MLAVTQVTSQGTTTSNLLKARTQHAAQDVTLTKLGLLKSGKLSVAVLAQVGIQDPGLSFRCICHLGKPIKTRFESGFCLLCTSHDPCRLSPYHQVWEIWLYRIVSALCGGIWIQSWEEASYVQSLWEDFPAPERHTVRLFPRQK